MTSLLSHTLLVGIVGISILLMLVRPKKIPEVYWTGGGAILLVALRLFPLRAAGKAVLDGGDVYLFLIGMMLLSALAQDTGVFDWISSVAVRSSDGSCARLFALIYAIGTLVTIFMSNDATAVVLTPAILASARKAKIDPVPHLFVCALIANAASFVLPISNPANLVVFHQRMPSLGHWLLAFGLPSLFSIASTYLVIRLYFRNSLRASIDQTTEMISLRREGRLVLWGLIFITGLLLIVSQLKRDLGLPACLAALLITGIVSLYTRRNPLKLIKKISWGTLVLVAALFVMVNAVEDLGVLQHTVGWLTWAHSHLSTIAGTYLTGFTVAIANNLVNNLPLGLIAGATIYAGHASSALVNAILIGVDLGPNLSITGSLATVLWLLAIRKEKLDVSFWAFLKVGLIAMPIALVFALGSSLISDTLWGGR